MKKCSKCKEEKELSEFHKNKSFKDGYFSYCKKCYKQYYINNRSKILEKHKIYRKNNKEKIREYSKKHSIVYKNRKNEIRKIRRINDINFTLKDRLRARVGQALRNFMKSNSTANLIGCSLEQLKEHLQQTAILNEYKDFDINNYNGKEYHIDHIIPCSAFDLSKEEEQRKCFHYTNLQILTAKENLEKSDKENICF